MIDTLNMWIDVATMAGNNPFTIAAYLTDIEEKQSEKWGYSVGGKLGNYTVYVNQQGVSLKGSLAKYYLSSNVYTLNRRQVEEALQQMSDQLHTDVTLATVRRVDVGTVIPTKRPPADYYCELGNKERFKRVQTTPDTLEYRMKTNKRGLIFYDKVIEAKNNKYSIPPTLADCNLLRYEMRLLKQPNKQLKRANPIQAAILYNPDFYYMLVQQWKQEFDSIKKIHRLSLNMENIKTPKDVSNALLGYLMQQNGGQELINRVMADLKAGKVFNDRKYYSRIRSDLNKILQAAGGQESELMRELEQVIANVAMYAR